MMLPQVIQDKDLPKSGRPSKEGRSQEDFTLPKNFSREVSAIMRNKNILEISNVEQPSLGGGLVELVFTSPSQLREHNKLKNKVKTITFLS
jgi:hypothetical protein